MGRALSADVTCPACKQRQSRVIDVEGTPEGGVRRRRKCACGHRYTTDEGIRDQDRRRIDLRVAKLESAIEELKGIAAAIRSAT